MLLTLHCLNELRASGQLDSLLASGSRPSETMLVLTEHQRGELGSTPSWRFGSVHVFERLWRQTGPKEVIEKLVEGRKSGFPMERAVFFTVHHRLLTSGSDRAALGTWQEDYEIEGTEDLLLHQLYRAAALLGEELPEVEQAGVTPFSPRCLRGA